VHRRMIPAAIILAGLLMVESGTSTSGAADSAITPHPQSVAREERDHRAGARHDCGAPLRQVVQSLNGALTLTPFRGVTPHLTYAEETLLWATDGLSGLSRALALETSR